MTMKRSKTLAFLVHLLTGSGAALALLALVSATQGHWTAMYGWLIVAFIVDGIDGPLARKVDTKTHASNWDGAVLDLVIDYLNYVFIPAYVLIYSDLLPSPYGLAAALLVALTGVVYFADVRMKAADNSFVGFPACWQMLVLVFLVFTPPVWATMAITLVLAIAQFVPLKFIHPVRTVRWRALNLPILLIWAALAAWSVWHHFAPGDVVKLGLLVTSVWLLLIGIVMQVIPERKRAKRPVSAE
ncbi:CDP-alcohol phosphatidyltransferase family protein [Amaricoccus solimangrovi]|uniref:Phosphatidylcholine synthase n=1 Tax=Amaricoccus solimangrovi TaxID=2589815 RepID=A0A501X109_9RHOB|nr:CDP-alcohol phosphatidyltransferase family protein [Amaricoccus solimangrovi]TPE53921.1 phosphatidylcholine synthase [Amaricoccus solimangrovi]